MGLVGFVVGGVEKVLRVGRNGWEPEYLLNNYLGGFGGFYNRRSKRSIVSGK